MNKENFGLWLEALRSGEYSQTTHFLADDRGYCCLGVACEVAIKNGVPLLSRRTGVASTNPKEYSVSPNDTEDGLDDVSKTHLPQLVKDWLGVGNSWVAVKVDRALLSPQELREWDQVSSEEEGVNVVWLNDSAGWDFIKIADAIEKTYFAEEAVNVAE